VTGVILHPYGPRVYVLGRRVHHGAVGCMALAAAAATRRRWLVGVGALLVSHDARDFPWRDVDNHPPSSRRLRLSALLTKASARSSLP
jgi:hypothetical protein